MGTTLVGLLTEERRAWVDQCGRQPLLSAARAVSELSRRITRWLKSRCGWDDDARGGARSPMRNVITRALGTQSRVTPDIFELEPEPGDLFLLCSDGLTRELSDAMIESLLAAEMPLDGACARLVEVAKKAGGHDNITCILVRVSS